MSANYTYKDLVNHVLTNGISGSSILKFMDELSNEYGQLLSSPGFLYRHQSRGGIFSPENRAYEVPSKSGCLATYSPAQNTEAKYLRDIFNNKILVTSDYRNPLDRIYLFAYEAPLMRVVSEKQFRLRVSADLVGVNDNDELIVIETKLPGGDSLDSAILQCFGYAFILIKHLMGAHRNDVIEHAKESLVKFHVLDKTAHKIQKCSKIKYMVVAPSSYFAENTSDIETLSRARNLIAELERLSTPQGSTEPVFGGFAVVENIHLTIKDIQNLEQYCNELSASSFYFMLLPFALDETRRQVSLKKQGFFSDDVRSREKGKYKNYDVDYCFPEEFSELNIYGQFRREAHEYFRDKNIKWHKLGQNHLRSSQAYCVNFFFIFRNRPEALRELLLPVYSDIEKMLPIEDDYYVAFEWNGGKNYLNEQKFRDNSRGEYATYPDAAVKYAAIDGTVKIVLIEWKYTESYSSESKVSGEPGTVRLNTYRPFFQKAYCPIALNRIDSNVERAMDSLFYEPFYQLFRQQLLAAEIENDSSHEVHTVSVLHICPKLNLLFANGVTSPALADLFPQQSVTEIWKGLLHDPDRFKSVDQGELFEKISQKAVPGFGDWQAYMKTRYNL